MGDFFAADRVLDAGFFGADAGDTGAAESAELLVVGWLADVAVVVFMFSGPCRLMVTLQV